MRRKGRFNTTIFSLILILVFFGIRMMLPNNTVPQEEIIIENFQPATVTKVVDGDTIWIDINGVEEIVRFIGVNTPEKNEQGFNEAREYTKMMLQDKYILLEKDISETDQYDRLLRYVWFDVPNNHSDSEKELKLFNGILLKSGYAEIATYKPDIKYLDYYNRLLEQE